MEWLQQMVDMYKTDLPMLAAFVLGLMTAISPCPLATNITATAYLSKNLTEKRKVLFNGGFYTLGRMVTYTTLGLIFYFGASQFQVAKFIQGIGGIWLGIALVVAGILMLDIIKFNIPFLDKLKPKVNEDKQHGGYWNAFIMGIVFALTFCPFSGVLYFGILIPMTIATPAGLLLPPIFSIATGLPVIIIAWLLAYSMSNIGKFYNSMQSFEKWFKRVIASIFILVGIYYIITYI